MKNKKYLPGFMIVVFAVISMAFTYKASLPQEAETTDNESFTYRKMTNAAFGFNEKLEYRVHYGLINAATVVTEVGSAYVEKSDRKCFNIKAEGKTLKSFDWA